MCAALGGVLSVDEAVILLAVVIAMRHSDLEIPGLEVYYRVEALLGHVVHEEVDHTVLAFKLLAVVGERESLIEIGIVFEHLDDELVAVGVVLEDLGVGSELDERTVLLVGWLNVVFADHDAF